MPISTIIYHKGLRRLIYLGYLLEKESMEMFSIGERSKSKHKFSETKVCEAEEEREYFTNPKIEIEVFAQ